MRKMRKILNVVIFTLQITRIVWTYYDTHADAIRALIADAQDAIAQMKRARESLAQDAGRDFAMRAFSRLKASLDADAQGNK